MLDSTHWHWLIASHLEFMKEQRYLGIWDSSRKLIMVESGKGEKKGRYIIEKFSWDRACLKDLWNFSWRWESHGAISTIICAEIAADQEELEKSLLDIARSGRLTSKFPKSAKSQRTTHRKPSSGSTMPVQSHGDSEEPPPRETPTIWMI